MADSSPASETVLVLAPIGRDGPAAAALLRDTGLTAEICTGLEKLRTVLEVGAGAAVITEEAFYREPIEHLVSWIETQPPWSDFPFIVSVLHGSGYGCVEASR